MPQIQTLTAAVPEEVITAAKLAWGDRTIRRFNVPHYIPPVRHGGATDQIIRLIAPIFYAAALREAEQVADTHDYAQTLSILRARAEALE